MKLKQIIGSFTAVAVILAATAFPQMPVYAATDFATAQDFLTDVINTSLTEIESSGKVAAVTTTTGKITTNGNEVLFDGARIGYWTSSASSTLYADSACTTPLIEEVAEGYDCDPTVLKTLLADTNSNIVENYTPTTDDWSKIVGRYDITLGDITIPAEQWLPIEVTDSAEPILTNDVINISQISGMYGKDADSYQFYSGTFSASFYVVDTEGKLYIQNTLTHLYGTGSAWRESTNAHILGSNNSFCTAYGVSKATGSSLANFIKAGMTHDDSGHLFGALYATSATNDRAIYFSTVNTASTELDAVDSNKFCNINDAGDFFVYDNNNIKTAGVFYITSDQTRSGGITDLGKFGSVHNKMFESYSTSRLVQGNTKLTKRVNALSQLTSSDVITVKADGWYMIDGSNIDTHITTQNIQSAGDTADISAVADVEPLNFNVIVPSALPIYVDSNGVVSTATNASIINRSGAPIQITGVNIAAKPESGWTLVQGNPSKQFEAKEFSFLTSIENLTVLDSGQEMPFTYNADLSPTTVGEDGLDIATVSVTVDWAS